MKPYTKASLVADALSLGSHWVYNQNELARLYPDGVHTFTDPASSYHPNRTAGQFTHYGDQTSWLADLIEKESGFDAEKWRQHWCESMSGYDGYVDGASKETLANDGNQPSGSNDLAGASRIAPILDLDLPLDESVTAARAQTTLTHGDPAIGDSAEFFVRAVKAVEAGADFRSAFEKAAGEGRYDSLDVDGAIAAATETQSESFLEASSALGLTCHASEAFPLALYVALQPNADFISAISSNALAGGDTSARAMLIALLFAARDGDVSSELASQLKS